MKIAFIFSICMLLLCTFSGCSKGNSFQAILEQKLGSSKLRVGATLEDFIKHFGEPESVLQKDDGHSFFYWQDAGIAVFCHPLYKKQYEYIKQEKCTVTSILVPFMKKISPHLPPCEHNVFINFNKILFLKNDFNKEWLNKDNIYAYYNAKGQLEAIEIRKPDSLIGDYD